MQLRLINCCTVYNFKLKYHSKQVHDHHTLTKGLYQFIGFVEMYLLICSPLHNCFKFHTSALFIEQSAFVLIGKNRYEGSLTFLNCVLYFRSLQQAHASYIIFIRWSPIAGSHRC